MTVNSKLNKSWISLSELSTRNDKTTETTVRFMMRKHYDTEHNKVAYRKEIEKTVRKKTTQEEESSEMVDCSSGAKDDCSIAPVKQEQEQATDDPLEQEDVVVLPGLPKILMQSKPEQPEQKKNKWVELP